LTWGAPFVLPVQDSDTDPDDISSLVAFGGNKIGVMWSNQKDSTNYFAVHLDGGADTIWQPREIALSGAGLGRVAEDHFSLKAARDGSGNLYAATLTNLSGSKAAGIFVLKRTAAGAWTRHVFATVGLNHTRPLLMLDEENQRAYVFARSTETGPAIVYMKNASLSSLVFPAGLGTPIIHSATDINITNPTSTKQSANNATGILVLAADKDSRYYLHNHLNFADTEPKIISFTPANGPAGALVTITGSQFGNATEVRFNGKLASFIILSDTQLHATVPLGATTGPISVANSAGTGASTFNFIVQPKLVISLLGAGNVSLNPPGGVYYAGTVVTLTATPAAGYVFSGYSGDFKGWKNVETITINADKNLVATFSPLPTPRYATGIWTSAAEISKLPASGLGWINLKAGADKPIGSPNLSDNEDSVNVAILAKALVYSRTGNPAYRQAVIAACMAAIGTEQNGETLALGRELLAYVLAADLVGLPPSEEAAFRNWLRSLLTKDLHGQTLRTSHELRPNNWGTHCGATRAAIARYLGDATELERAARVFKGWLGDRNTYAGFSYDLNELSWQSNPNAPVGVNPLGAMIQGHPVDGVLPDDQRRAGPFAWPPPQENYVYGALQGALMQAIILHRAGYDVWNWENQALLRAMKWLYNEGNYPAGGDDKWLPHIINYFYKMNFPAPVPAKPGKNAGWTDWLYGSKFALTVSDNGGDIEIHSLGINNDSLAVMKLTAIPDLGYKFSGWSGALTGATNPAILVMNANKNVIANFVKSGPFTVTVTPVGSGAVALNPAGGVYSGGTVVTLTAKPTTGFKFVGWSKDLSGATNPASLTMNANKNVTAVFKPVYNLTTNVVGSGAITLNPPSGPYDAGTIVTLTATASSGYQFVEWTGDWVGATNPVKITMDANKNVTAAFAATQVVHQETKTGGASSSVSVTTSANLTGVSGQLYLAAITTRPKVQVNSIKGLDLNWKLVKAQCAGRNNIRVELWMAQGAAADSGKVTATLAAAATNAVIAVTRYSGVAVANPLGNVISGNTKGMNGTCTGGWDNSSYSFNFNTTANGAVVYGVIGLRNRTHMPGINYVERAEIKQGSTSNVATLAVEDRIVPVTGTLTVNGTFSGDTDWVVVAVEIKPQLVTAPLLRSANADPATVAPLPADFQFLQNYPNPFNPATTISYRLPAAMHVTLKIFNLTGQAVATLRDAYQAAGPHEVIFEASHLPSGNYFMVLQADGKKNVRRIVLMK
jgi:hypothetical protein